MDFDKSIKNIQPQTPQIVKTSNELIKETEVEEKKFKMGSQTLVSHQESTPVIPLSKLLVIRKLKYKLGPPLKSTLHSLALSL